MVSVQSKAARRLGSDTVCGIPTIVVLGCLVSMGALHTDPIAASLPGMAEELGCGANGTATVISMFLLGMMVGHLLIGPISDVIGRKRSILAGLVILVAGAVICALSQTLHFLVIGRVVQGIGGAAATCSARAIGNDSGDSATSARVLSLMQVFSSATPIIMPLIGNGIAGRFGWRSVFWFMALIDGALLVSTLVLVSETVRPRKENAWKQLGADISSAFRKPTFLLYTFSFGFGISAFYCYTSASSFALQNELGISPTAYSKFLSAAGVTMVFAAMLASRLPKKFGLVRSFSAAVVIQFISAVVMAAAFLTHFASIPLVIICYAVIAGGAAVSIPMGLSLAVGESGNIKGTASALCGFVQCFCSWLITVLLSFVGEEGSIGATAGLAMALTTCAAFALCSIATRIAGARETKNNV